MIDGGDSAASSRRDADARFNRIVLTGDVTCFFVGMAFLDTSTVLPVLVAKLGGGSAVLALLAALRQAGYYLPQLFVAHRIRGRTRCKPLLLKVCGFGRMWLFGASLIVWRAGRTAPSVALLALCAAYALSWMGDGMGGVPWTTIVGKAVPANSRGRLFATTQVLAGVGRFGVGAAVAVLLAGRLLSSPANWAAIVLCAALALGASCVFLALIREPASDAFMESAADGIAAAPPAGLARFLAAIPGRFRSRPDIARLAMAQLLVGAVAAVSPFLWGQAQRFIPGGLEPRAAGAFLIVQTVGLLVCAPLLGALTDRRGANRTLRVLFCLSLVCLLAAVLGACSYGGRIWHLILFGSAYFCLGGTADAWTTITNYLLEAVPTQSEQATYVAMINASSAPALLFPILLSHFVAPDGAATAAFAVAALIVAVGLVVAVSLPDARHRSR